MEYVAVAVVVCVAVLLLWRWFRGSSLVDSLLNARAADAVQAAERDFGVRLDYSVDSLGVLDSRILEVLHRRHVESTGDARAVRQAGALWGPYVGAVLKRALGLGHWETDSQVAGKGALPLIFSPGDEVYPCSWVEKRIVNGDEDRVDVKGQSVLARKTTELRPLQL